MNAVRLIVKVIIALALFVFLVPVFAIFGVFGGCLVSAFGGLSGNIGDTAMISGTIFGVLSGIIVTILVVSQIR